MTEELLLDIEELRHLQNIATRPSVLSFISSEISNLDKLLTEAVSATSASHIPAPTPAPTPIPTPAKVTSTVAVNYTTLPSFSWDQDSDKVKIYVSLKGVDQEKVEALFNETSCDVIFNDVQGKNYRFAIPKLNGKIAPENCKVVIKPTRVIITLLKASKGNWMDLQFKADKLKRNLDKEKDPMAGIMGLMKNMYEDGDEEMKRTIPKAWTDARSGKAANPLKGYR